MFLGAHCLRRLCCSDGLVASYPPELLPIHQWVDDGLDVASQSRSSRSAECHVRGKTFHISSHARFPKFCGCAFGPNWTQWPLSLPDWTYRYPRVIQGVLLFRSRFRDLFRLSAGSALRSSVTLI